ncbi:MAG: tetratricopeptide repeat protein [Verrucomicrobiota bacterium]
MMIKFVKIWGDPIKVWAICVCLIGSSGAVAQQEPVSRATSEDVEAEDPVARSYRQLLELDDAALTEVDEWIRKANQTQDGVNDPSLINLPAKIEQRLKPVRKAYDEFIEKHPEHVGVRLAYASFLTDRGDEMAAVPHLTKATELDPDNPAAWNNLGNHYGHMGPVKKAFECYQKAIQLNPDAAVYYHNYGTTVYLFRKDAKEHFSISEEEVFDKALELYAVALKKDPNNFDLAEDIAQTYYGIRTQTPPRKMARPKEALEAWDYALKIAPGENEKQGVYIHQARILLGLDQVAEARQALDKVNLPVYQGLKERILGNVNERTDEILPPAVLR